MDSLLTSNTFDPNTAIPDLAGKVYIVTGGTAGIGFGITAHILQHGPEKIYILSNKEKHAEEARKELEKYGDVSKVEWKQCDLKDLKQVDAVAKELKQSLTKLDALVCNAGIGVGPYAETIDGIDSHMQVNFIAQFHLAMILLPVLQKTPNSRLVLQSSDLHRPINHTGADSKVAFESLAELNRDIGATNLYNRTKFAQILFIHAFHRRKTQGKLGFVGDVKAPYTNATHPGGVSTDQQEQAVEAYGTLGKIGVTLMRPLLKDPVEQGCRPALFAATSTTIVEEGIDGAYIIPDRKVSEPSKATMDQELQENLWTLTGDILKEKLGSLPYTM